MRVPGWLLRAWDDAMAEDRERAVPRRLLPFHGFRSGQTPKGGRWELEMPRLDLLPPTPDLRGFERLVLGTLAVVGLGLLFHATGWLPAWGAVPLFGSIYDWTGVRDRFDESVATARMSSEAALISGVGALPISAQRDAALAEVLNYLRVGGTDPFPGLMGPVFNVKAFGATGDGVADDTVATQAWLAATAGKRGYVPTGSYQLGSALSLVDSAAPHDFNGTVIEGAGWDYISNGGSELVFAGAVGPLFTLGSTDTTDPGLINLTIRNLAIRATNAGLVGALVRLLNGGEITFEDVRFVGADAGTLIEGLEWVSVRFVRCRFENAAVGVETKAFAGFSSFANVVHFEDCFFVDLPTIADLRVACRTVYFEHCVFERASSGGPTGAILVGGHGAIFDSCWAGDANGSGTWITATGEKLTVTNCDLRSGAFAIDDDTLFGAVIDGNHTLEGATAAVRVQSTKKTRVSNNRILVTANNAVGVDVTAGTGHAILDNDVTLSGGVTGTIGYRLAASTAGELRDGKPGNVATAIQDNSAGGWKLLRAGAGAISADRGDANRTLTVGTDAEVQRFATTLTANRTVSLSTTDPEGGRFRVVRTGLGAFTLDVGGLKTIPSATAAIVDVAFDPISDAWILVGYGTL